MKKKRIAINGFGRIGRMVLRAGITDDNLEFVACNDLTDKETLAYLFKYDSAQGTFSGDVQVTQQGISINGKEIQILAQKDPSTLPWKKLGIDIVIESTGRFRTKEQAQQHLSAGAKKVLLSAPAKSDGIKTLVMGVNEHTYNSSTDHIVSNASCTTNCLAPIVKVLDDNFGVQQGQMTTVHAYTGDQRLVDSPHNDKRRGRSAATNIIPTTTGAAKAVTQVLPHLQGKLEGMAVRVPVIDGSLTDFTCQLSRTPSKEELDHLFTSVSQHHLQGILAYEQQPLVSSDIIGNAHSCIVDAQLTSIAGSLVKIVAWYDNEWGYSNRIIQVLHLL